MNKISRADHERTFRRNAEVENGMLRMESWDGVDEVQTSKSTTHTRAREIPRPSWCEMEHVEVWEASDGGWLPRKDSSNARRWRFSWTLRRPRREKVVHPAHRDPRTCTDQERTQFPSTAQATPRTNKYFAVAVVSGAKCRSEKATCYSWCSRTAAQWRLAASTQVHTRDAAQQCEIVAVGSDGAGGRERASNEGAGEPTSKRRAVMRARRQKSGGGSGEAAGGRYMGAPSAEGPQDDEKYPFKETYGIDRREARKSRKNFQLSGSDAEICFEMIQIRYGPEKASTRGKPSFEENQTLWAKVPPRF
ncbi:hypothetical protein R3P38DRAFT_2773780 [Favolaschia claudopus]|uniref:Uncharacterized protein n=1 Tax=Favolaschia claudopus TaxID=2862362 RepID=A0AAW0C489_9AGAR